VFGTAAVENRTAHSLPTVGAKSAALNATHTAEEETEGRVVAAETGETEAVAVLQSAAVRGKRGRDEGQKGLSDMEQQEHLPLSEQNAHRHQQQLQCSSEDLQQQNEGMGEGAGASAIRTAVQALRVTLRQKYVSNVQIHVYGELVGFLCCFTGCSVQSQPMPKGMPILFARFLPNWSIILAVKPPTVKSVHQLVPLTDFSPSISP